MKRECVEWQKEVVEGSSGNQLLLTQEEWSKRYTKGGIYTSTRGRARGAYRGRDGFHSKFTIMEEVIK